MKKTFAFILAVIMVLSCFAGCQKKEDTSDLAYIKGKGKLVVGITEYAPMDFKDANGNWKIIREHTAKDTYTVKNLAADTKYSNHFQFIILKGFFQSHLASHITIL